MKCFTVLAFAGLGAAQIATLIGVVNTISQATSDFDTTIKSFSGASDTTGLQAASDKVASAVKSGISTVNSAQTVTLTDAVQIQGQVQSLQTAVEGVVNDLISKKQTIYSAGAGAMVETNLQAQLAGAQALSKAISDKVPTEVQGLAQTLSAGIATSLGKGVDAFKDAPAGGAPASGGSAPASSAASAPVASSAAAAPSASKGATKTAGTAPAVTSSHPKPATYTGAASSRNIAGGFAAVAAVVAVAL